MVLPHVRFTYQRSQVLWYGTRSFVAANGDIDPRHCQQSAKEKNTWQYGGPISGTIMMQLLVFHFPLIQTPVTTHPGKLDERPGESRVLTFGKKDPIGLALEPAHPSRTAKTGLLLRSRGVVVIRQRQDRAGAVDVYWADTKRYSFWSRLDNKKEAATPYYTACCRASIGMARGRHL
jgi:hypothetical protein